MSKPKPRDLRDGKILSALILAVLVTYMVLATAAQAR